MKDLSSPEGIGPKYLLKAARNSAVIESAHAQGLVRPAGEVVGPGDQVPGPKKSQTVLTQVTSSLIRRCRSAQIETSRSRTRRSCWGPTLGSAEIGFSMPSMTIRTDLSWLFNSALS